MSLESVFKCDDKRIIKDLTVYNEYLILKGNGESTRRQNLSYIKKFLLEHGEFSVKNVYDFLHKKDENGKKKNAKGAMYVYFKKYAKFLLKNKLIDKELFDDIEEYQRQYKNTRVRDKWKVPYDRWSECYGQLEYEVQRIAIWLGFNFMLRANEIINLQWKHINFNDGKYGSIKITETEDHKLKTSNSNRTLPMASHHRQILLDYKEKWDNLGLDHDYLVYIPTGEYKNLPISYKGFYGWCQKVSIIIKVKGNDVKKILRPHVLRYSGASDLFMKHGINSLYTLSKMLGHNDIKTTQDYLVVTEKELHEEMLQLFI
ncbi:MAG: tyrosine-type recombinase/integrase, partial [Candidatus Thorarchaeota archaeon]